MDIQALIAYCLQKKGAESDYPFDMETLVIKVGSKIFALFGERQGIPYINLKCDPELAVILRQGSAAVTPGYHMNKEHWNSVAFNDDDIPENEVFRMVDHSYELVFKSLSRKEKAAVSG